MGYLWLLFGFSDRINRARIWLAGLIMLGCMLLLGAAMVTVGKLLGLPINSFSFGTDDIFNIIDPASYRAMPSANLFETIVHVVATPLFVWIYAALAIKRLHDRDRSGWWMVPVFVVPGLYDKLGDRLGDSIPAIALAVVVFGVGMCRTVFSQGNGRWQPVWWRPAGLARACRYEAGLGPAKRTRICAASRWPIGGTSC